MPNYLKKILFSSLILMIPYINSISKAMDNSYVIAEKVYDDTVTYSAGVFKHFNKKEDATLSTAPQVSQKPYGQRALVYTEEPQERKQENFQQERVLQKVIPHQDGRMRISDTTKWPYTIFTQLSMVFDGRVYGGTGSLVGPHHVLTCGHNVYGEGKWADKILVYPALNEKHAPFGEIKVVKVHTFNGWVNSGDKRFDMALLILNKSIGEHTGWGGLLSSLDDTKLSQQKVSITGYPGDKGLTQMWTMTHILKTINQEEFDYEIDTCGGQSGSGIWIDNWGMPMILGVHTLGGDSINSGVRLSGKKFTDLLMKAISETYTINNKDSISTVVSKTNTIQPKTVALTIPLVEQEYEEIYKRFLKGVLIYRPQEGSDVGRKDMRISDLVNPLEGTFDLSKCSEKIDKSLIISTGYRKKKKTENASKLEIWISPRFLIKKELEDVSKTF